MGEEKNKQKDKIMPNKRNIQAYRARTCIPMQGETSARGADLLKPLISIDDALMLIQDGRVLCVEKYAEKNLPAGMSAQDVHDLGEGILVPAAVNAHTHIQLSHLAERTLWGQGFVPWLESLIQQLAVPMDTAAIQKALEQMRTTGTGYFADYTSGGMHLVAKAAQSAGLKGLLTAEWFGYDDTWQEGEFLPSRARAVREYLVSNFHEQLVPCAHALYSTAAQSVQGAHAWCTKQEAAHKKTFALHLAEFEEEVEALTYGKGALVDLYTPVVLSPQWQAPLCHPVDYAQKLGVLTENTLAVHCVQCEDSHVQTLGEVGLSVCLCPRSNANLGVDKAPVKAFMQSGVNLCLGTDGLTSNVDVDVWNEALFLRDFFDVPFTACLRMLTVNGAHAFGVGLQQRSTQVYGSLMKGSPAHWHFLPFGW